MNTKKLALLLFIGWLGLPLGYSQEDVAYQMPPPEIAELVDAPNLPQTMLNDQRTWMLSLQAPRYVDLTIAAHPIAGLGGLRINPEIRSLAGEHHGFFTEITVRNLREDGAPSTLTGLPRDLKMSHITWHPEGNGFAFTQQTTTGLQVWYADLQSMSARQLMDQRMNALIGTFLTWHPKGDFLLVQVPAFDGQPEPVKARLPHGPVVQENLGTRSPTRTYTNLLTNKHDENMFDYYVTSQLVKVYLDGRQEPYGQPGIFKRNEFSPDGQYLLVETIEKPYSYTVGANSFPTRITLWDVSGTSFKQLSATSDTTSRKPRSFNWRADHPNELIWVRSFSREDTVYRDGIYGLVAPFTGDERMIFRTTMAYGSVLWGNADYAIVQEQDRRARQVKWSLINPTSGELVKVIEDRSTEDTYADPGRFVQSGGLLQISGTRRQPTVHTISAGASPQGERPFLLRWNLMKDTRDTLFRSSGEQYERPVDFDGDRTLYFTRETWNIPPNMIQKDLRIGREKALTEYGLLYPSLAGVTKSLMTYPRADGVQLSGTLYLPPGFQPGVSEPLPVVVWAYPREYKSAELASQVKGSPNRFTELNFRSAVYWVNRGYAVVDMADMPIIGEGDEEPNDTFVEQLILNSEALIDHMVEAGIADRDRFGIGGHSYGAFMTANLLAHSDLFAAGIARSGAYNRTLTPFGFQSESRTYWRAKEVYDRMSPFTYADKIKLPILITHGIDDENSGTFPVQSERLYAAIKGNGGTARLVMFPHEFHGFRSRESIMHVFWEQDRWLEKYVKNREKKEDKE